MSNYRDIIDRLNGQKFICCRHDEETGRYMDKIILSRQEAIDTLEDAEIYTFAEDDGIGVLVFYRKSSPENVHSMLMSL